MKKFLIFSTIVASSLFANVNLIKKNITSQILFKGTFLEKQIKEKDLIVKYKKIDKDFVLINIRRKGDPRTLALFEYLPKKYFFLGQMIDKNGKIVTPYIVDKKVVKDAVAFTFGNGKEDLYIVTDPECPFCRELEKEKGDILKKKYKIHVILYPLEEIHPDSKKMIEYILSQPKNKQVQTFVNVLTGKDNKWENFEPTEKQIQKTEEYLKKSQKAFQELRATGTPSVYDKDFNLVNPANLK